ncbi:MAG TPA: hypothetical protein DCW41_06915 [Clostridiales bacterium]|nr:hypothetical protein [Clostridiales bacterium]
MGSTLETAVVFSTVLIILTFLITAPMLICGDIRDEFLVLLEEQEQYTDNGELIREEDMGGYDLRDVGSERLNTFLTGISENYRIIYGTLGEMFDEED